MKKRKFKMLIIGTLALIMILNVSPIYSQASKVGMSILKGHNTNKIITLRDNPIKIPNHMIQKEEQFRGVWVSTVYNLDFPSQKGISEKKYKAEYITLLNNLENLNMNAIIFQVRPKLDAFYKSNINPWSEYLSGTQGKNPGWDPMEWMIEETHKRGMEFHAWFNPYRVTTAREDKKTIKQELQSLSENNWARLNPQYVYRYDGKLQLNPGEPQVIEYINKSIMEVVENYNIDAVHFDDYFYPFKRNDNLYFPGEKATFKKYKGNFKSIDDWRRNNVDTLVEKVNSSINEYNNRQGKSIQFGISPFAIWGHQGSSKIANVGEGSRTPITSSSSYNQQFADTRKWVKNNWVDYIAPQVYWTFDEKAAPYGEIVHWWTDVVKDTNVHLYIGHANYKINESKLRSSWKNPEELCNQLKFNSQYDEVKGSIFFRYKNLLKSAKGNTENDKFINLLKNDHFKDKANLPEKPWLKPETLVVEVIKSNKGNVITWKDNMNDNKNYTIYRETLDSEDNIIDTVQIKTIEKFKDNSIYGYFDKILDKGANYKYYISANNAESNNTIAYGK